MSGARHPRALAVGAKELRGRVNLHALRIERGHKRLDLVVAERPVDLRVDHRSRRRGVRVVRRVELEEPGLTAGVPGRDARVTARCLLPPDGPARRIRRGSVHGATDNLVDRERFRPDAVGEPARVRDLVDRVDVLRPHAGRLMAGQGEQVVGQFVHQVETGRRGAAGILRLGLAKDGVVRIETRGRGGHRADRRERRDRDSRDEGRSAHMHDSRSHLENR
jgi:hypothetical protein